MRTLPHIQCTAVGCTNQASMKHGDDLLCAQHSDARVQHDACTYIDNLVRGQRLDHVHHRRRTLGQHLAYVAVTAGLYGATAETVMRTINDFDEIEGIVTLEQAQAVLDYLK